MHIKARTETNTKNITIVIVIAGCRLNWNWRNWNVSVCQKEWRRVRKKNKTTKRKCDEWIKEFSFFLSCSFGFIWWWLRVSYATIDRWIVHQSIFGRKICISLIHSSFCWVFFSSLRFSCSILPSASAFVKNFMMFVCFHLNRFFWFVNWFSSFVVPTVLLLARRSSVWWKREYIRVNWCVYLWLRCHWIKLRNHFTNIYLARY